MILDAEMNSIFQCYSGPQTLGSTVDQEAGDSQENTR